MSNTFNIIAVDPGNNIGISIFTIDDTSYDIVNVETHTIVLGKRVNAKDNMATKILYLNKYFTSLLEKYEPLIVAEEAAFLNIRFPRAVMLLSQYIASIDLAIKSYSSDVKVYRYPPKLVKKRVGASGNADKDMMLETVSKITEINKYVDFDKITEHEVDAIAIGYVLIKEMREYPEILIKNI